MSHIEFTPEERMEFFWEPCKSKEELRQHMRIFFDLDFPNQLIDEDSTSTPLDFIWAVYQVMMTGKGPTKHVVAASRGTTKTLSAAVVRLYGMIHFRRDGTHLAATEDQSKSANMYLDRFLLMPELQPYVSESNTKTRLLKGMPANSHTKKDWALLRVAVATPAGVNSQRGSLNTKDEVDLIASSILSEGVLVAEPTQDEHQFAAISLYLSSRKSNSGPVQKMLDDHDEKPNPRVQIHKWSLVDWMRTCPPSIHRPDLPKEDAWIDEESLKVVWGKDNYENMNEAQANKQKHVVAFQGCKTCPAFLVCQGRSPYQRGKMRHLRDIEFVGDLIDEVGDTDKIIAQVLNQRPESSSIVFRRFSRSRHFLKPHKAWQWLFNEEYNPHKLTRDEIEAIWKEERIADYRKIIPGKIDIYNKMRETGWTIHYGVDFGYKPDPACVLVVCFHKKTARAFILHADEGLEFTDEDWAQYIKDYVEPMYPHDLVCPDTAKGTAHVYFRRRGMTSLSKKPPRIESGVSQIRALLWNPKEQTERMVVLDDSDFEGGKNKWVADSLAKWTHKKGQLGFDFNKFDTDSEWSHVCDSLRYALDPFIDVMAVTIRAHQPKTKEDALKEAAAGNPESLRKFQQEAEQTIKTQFQEHMAREFGLTGVFDTEQRLKTEKIEPVASEINTPTPKRSGSLKFSFSK